MTYSGNNWVKGKIENGNLIFNCGEEIDNFSYSYVLSGLVWGFDPGSPIFSILKAGKTDESGNFVPDETITEIELEGTDGGNFVFKPKNTEGILYKNSRLIKSLTLTPIERNLTCPPEGSIEEDYQIDFQPYASAVYSEYRNTWSSLRLKVVKTKEEFYVKGLNAISYGHFENSNWIVGKISGNKVIFPYGQKSVGIVSDRYLNSVASSDRKNFQTTGKDLVFDYDPNTGTLSNPSADFIELFKPDITWTQNFPFGDVSLMYLGKWDYYRNAKIKKIPANYQYMQCTPKIKGKKIEINLEDANGYMMDPALLYYEITVDGQPQELTYVNMDNWNVETGYQCRVLPYYMHNLNNIDSNYVLDTKQEYEIPAKLVGENIEAKLIYKSENDEVYESSGIDSIGEETYSDNGNVYNLQGCQVMDNANADDLKKLPSGIYIYKGKKIAL